MLFFFETDLWRVANAQHSSSGAGAVPRQRRHKMNTIQPGNTPRSGFQIMTGYLYLPDIYTYRINLNIG